MDELGEVRLYGSEISVDYLLVVFFVITLIMIVRYFKSYYSDLSEFVDTKDFFNNIMESSANAIIASDNLGKVTYFSKGAEKIFGKKSSDVIGKKVMELYPREGGLKVAEGLREEESAKNITVTILTPSKKEKIISLDISSLKDSRGKVRGNVSIAKDITEEVRRSRQIQRLRELSEKVIEGTPDGIVIFDTARYITMVNRGFENIAGINKDSLIGKKVEDIDNPDMRGMLKAMGFKKNLERVASKKVTMDVEEFSAKIGRDKKTMTSFLVPLEDAQGKVEYILLILHDITERKALEEDLKKQAELLRQSNELKDMFTDILRHDILNPIGIIKTYTDILTEEKLDSEIKERIDRISKNAERTIEMVDSASALSKLESQDEISLEKRDLGAIIKEVSAEFKEKAAERSIALALDLKGEYLANINASIKNLFSNLISNAIKHGPSDSKIEVGIHKAGENWKVYVKDYGESIEDQYKKTIFKRFERREKGGTKGTGLGLAIVKKIADLHNGRVWVENNHEGGNIFYFEIMRFKK